MKEKELHLLVDKYLLGTASKEEVEILHLYYRTMADSENSWMDEPEDDVKQRVLLKIQKKVQNTRKTTSTKYWLRIAAVLLIGISVFSINKIFYNTLDNSNISVQKLPSNHHDSRYILLPDSSIVILTPGSELIYPKVFDGAERVVQLKGEAYFDIKHRDNLPFIIHSGRVKTVVLGTAFTIKSLNHDEVEVFVNRGKVRVDDGTQEIAVLTANHKLIYHPQEDNIIHNEETQIVKNEFEWRDTKMEFDGMTFKDITKKLEDRYSVKIMFKESQVGDYQLSGMFSGMENLDEVLTILCKTSGNSFRKIDNNNYEIMFN